MPKSFKEIGRKTEDLIEQGHEADRQVKSCASRVASLNAAVSNAQRELDRASRETDENGNPSGDVAGAQARLNMAKNQLAAGQRALNAAQQKAASVQNAKQSHAADIEKHNKVERSNISKLQKLQQLYSSSDSAALLRGIAQRLNEAEDSRVELLKSMGLDAVPEYVNVPGETNTGMGSGPGLRQVGISGGALHYQGGSGGAADAMGGVSLTLDNSSSGHGAGLSGAAAADYSANAMMPGEIGPGEFHEAMPQGMPGGGTGTDWASTMANAPAFDPANAERLKAEHAAQQRAQAIGGNVLSLVNNLIGSSEISDSSTKTDLEALRSELLAAAAWQESVNYLNNSTIPQAGVMPRTPNQILDDMRRSIRENWMNNFNAETLKKYGHCTQKMYEEKLELYRKGIGIIAGESYAATLSSDQLERISVVQNHAFKASLNLNETELKELYLNAKSDPVNCCTRTIEKKMDHKMRADAMALLSDPAFSADSWKKKSEAEKHASLDSLVGRMNSIFGTSVNASAVPYNEPSLGSRGYYSPQDNSVHINSYVMNSSGGAALRQTVVHEMRHAYQNYCINNPDKVLVSRETINKWAENNLPGHYVSVDKNAPPHIRALQYDAYLRQPIEWDAKNFAGQLRDVKGCTPDYEGSWTKW